MIGNGEKMYRGGVFAVGLESPTDERCTPATTDVCHSSAVGWSVSLCSGTAPAMCQHFALGSVLPVLSL